MKLLTEIARHLVAPQRPDEKDAKAMRLYNRALHAWRGIMGWSNILQWVWILWAVGLLGTVMPFAGRGLASEASVENLEQLLMKNTVALQCSSLDRRISKKTREMGNVQRLLDAETAADELRNLREQLAELNRDLEKMDKRYDDTCLQDGLDS